MIRHLLSCSAVLLALFLGGCQHNAQFEAASASSDKALVYLYRPKADNPGKKPLVFSYPDILIDGNSVGVLKYNEYLTLQVEPGEREFVATGLTEAANWKPENVSYRIKVAAGQRYFLRLRVAFDTDRMTIDSLTSKYLIHLHPMDEQSALYEIRYASPAAEM